MVDARTIEDLAMSLVVRQHSSVYNKRIRPVYRAVRRVVKKFFAVEGAIGYGTRYKYDCSLDSLEAPALVVELEGKFAPQLIPDEEANKMHKIYDTVVYFVEGVRGGDKAKELAERSYKAVLSIEEKVMAEVKSCLGDEEAEYKINTLFDELPGSTKEKLGELGKALDEKMVHKTIATKLLLKRTPYHVIAYLARRDVKL